MTEFLTPYGQEFADFITETELSSFFSYDTTEDEDGDDFLFYFGEQTDDIFVYGDIEFSEDTVTVNFFIRLDEVNDEELAGLLMYINFFNDNAPFKLTLSTKEMHEFPGEHLRLTLSETVGREIESVPQFVMGMFAILQEVLDEEILPELFEEEDEASEELPF